MSQLGREEALRLARLARLRLEPDEADALAADLRSILALAERLSEVDTDGVPPTSHVIPFATPVRSDDPVPSLAPELAVANAPAAYATAFAVPKVLENEEEG
ncbi:MAG: Asp-tRNA(Asn)/Glu-tRNA(Gln) amidotransferase subunit GatC [Myxococcales bacterium]|jgi:aspartyl-tRNA(Asn)/glutamyl-tRNA(Gln) amidotransferase subunit C|nr:Asp-tRNA(Asn)/Glu-tRNA(Gln) amidotransferase subunit GatC [Myxococcales bacterium]